MRPEPDSPYLADASNYRGRADELLIPENEAAVIDIMRRAAAVPGSPADAFPMAAGSFRWRS
jgi:hypothetical protein